MLTINTLISNNLLEEETKRMKKKLLSVLLSTAMVASLLVGCGSTEEAAPAADDATETEDTEEVVEEEKEEDTLEVTEAAKLEAPSTDGWDDSMKIYAYSWNDEFGSRLQYVLDEYPEYADYVEYINLGVSGTDGTYQTAIETAIETGAAEYPSLIAADNDVAKTFTESDYTMNLSDAGITEDMYSNAYQYTIDYAKVDGELKALTWQATPGNFTYRASIAEEVLGTSDPAEVQELIGGGSGSWDKFFEVADQMKEAGYAVISGPDDVKYAIWDQQTNPWVTVDADGNETLTLDDAVSEYFETAKKLYDGGYTDQTSMWSDGWSANFEGDVFGYFGCTWFVYWCIATTEDSETSTYGDWRVCEAPVGYHWGGTYVCIGADTPNPELAGFLLYELCADADIMYKISAETFDFVNNKEAVANLIADGKGASDILGGQNPVETWANAALAIDLSNSTYLDSALKGIMDKASEGYNAGTVEDPVQ